MALEPKQLRKYIPVYKTADTYVQALLQKRHPLLRPSARLSESELNTLLGEAEKMLKQARGPEFHEYLNVFYTARELGSIPFNFLRPDIPNARRVQARSFLGQRLVLGAIFSAFPWWNGDLPPSEALQWCWLVQTWRAAQGAKLKTARERLAICVGVVIGLNECFEGGYAAELARGGLGAALLRFDLFHASDEKAYQRVYRRLTRSRMPSLAQRSVRARAYKGRRDPRAARLDRLGSDVGVVAAEWLGRPIADTLSEFDGLRFAPKRLHDRVKDLRRHEMAQKRGAKATQVTAEETLVDSALGETRSEVEERFTNPVLADECINKVTADLGQTAGKIVAVLVKPGALPESVKKIAQEAGCDPKTFRKYRPKLEAHLGKFLQSRLAAARPPVSAT